MNLLIVGDDPTKIGGVTNYTRPLANQLAASGVNVHYVYNTTMNQEYDFGPMRVERFNRDGVHYYWLRNGKAMVFNYHDLDLDTNDWFDKLFIEIMETDKFDVVHINELFGFSTNVIHIAKQFGAKVISTIHDYWWLCPQKVMVDHNRQVCDGPSNMDKCVQCVEDRSQGHRPNIKKFQYKLRNTMPAVYKPVVSKIKAMKRSHYPVVPLDVLESSEIIATDNPLKAKLQNRLDKLVAAMNACDQITCVSNDVKRILTQYGVNPEVCVVDHIGSTIAEKEWQLRTDWQPKEKISFGFIGGMSYYKGVHLILQAYMRLPDLLKQKATIDIYGGGDPGYVQALENLLETGSHLDKQNIRLHGRYTPDQIEAIGKSIDVSILPSMCADTAPQTIFESFSSGLPILGPDIGGFSDFIHHGKNGLIFKYGDPDSLSNAMRELIENPETISSFCLNITPSKKMSTHINDMKRVYSEIVA